MILVVSAALAYGAEPRCTHVGLRDLVPEQTGPAVVVLGERRGVGSDQRKARAVVRALAKRANVVLAAQILPETGADVVARLERGELDLGSLAAAFGPEVAEGTSFAAWDPVLAVAIPDDPLAARVRLVPVGVPLADRRPADTPLAIPPLYIHVLAGAMGDGPMPPELEPRFVEQVAWIDHRIAAASLASWDGRGFLVVLVDRLHVEGGLGVAWQAKQLAAVPVHAALLADAGTVCVEADRILR